MAEPIYTNALLCERALVERDGVLSAIRIVDVFFVDPSSKIPPEERPIQMSLLFTAKFAESDESEHGMEVHLERPNESPVKIGETEPTKATGNYPNVPKGINLSVRFGVPPKVIGTHYINIMLDSRLVARIPVTLLPKDEQAGTEG